MSTVGDRLRDLPDMLQLEQQDVAAAMGVSKQRYSGWIANNRLPSADALLLLKERLGVNDAWVIRGPPAPLMIRDAVPDEYAARLQKILPGLTDQQKLRLVQQAEDSAEANRWRPQE